MLSSHAVIAASDRHIACTLGDEQVILHLDQGIYYGLDGVGAFVWDALKSPRTFDQMVDLVVAEYQVGRADCAADLQALLADLRAHGLLVVTEDT